MLACVAWTSSFGVAVVMSSPAVPEVRVMDAAEEPAAAGSVMEAPVAKAAGPAGPPTPMMVPDEPNISGRTVHGVLLEGKELLEIPVEELLALSLSSIEPAESLINDVCYEVAKTEAERWHRAADMAQESVYSLQSQMDQLVRLHAADPSQSLEETRVPTDSEDHGGLSHADLARKRQGMVVRQQQLRSGATFWGYVYFQSLSALPETVRHTTLGTTDGLHDLLRWSVGRFSKLSELFGQLGDYVGQLSESDAKTQQHFVTTATQLHDLANGIVGLSSSVRHCQDEMLKSARATAKSMSDTLWQVSGTGKTVNTPLKEVIMGVSKVVSQLDGTVTKQSKSLEKITTLLETLCSSMKELISVEQKKSTLVAQVSQAAKATSTTGTPTTPASVPGIAPPGSAPSGFVTPPTTGGAPQATLGTGHVASTSPPPAPKLMPTNLTPPMPSGFPPAPAFTGQNYGPPPAPAAGYTNTPMTPGTSVSGSGGGPPPPYWKRVRLADGSWAWAEPDQGDIGP